MTRIGQSFYAFVAAFNVAAAVLQAGEGRWGWTALNTGLAVLIILILFIELAYTDKKGSR